MQQVLTLLSNSMQTTLVALGELGEGGFAKVFSATCPAKPEMGAEMAVKLIKVSISALTHNCLLHLHPLCRKA